MIRVIYDEAIIWVNERNSLNGRRCIILLRENVCAPVKSNLTFLIDRLRRNLLEKLRWATGSLCTWWGDIDLSCPAKSTFIGKSVICF